MSLISDAPDERHHLYVVAFAMVATAVAGFREEPAPERRVPDLPFIGTAVLYLLRTRNSTRWRRSWFTRAAW